MSKKRKMVFALCQVLLMMVTLSYVAIAQNKIEIEFCYQMFTPPVNDFFAQLIDKFNKQNPDVKVIFSQQPAANYDAKLLSLFATEPPDLFTTECTLWQHLYFSDALAPVPVDRGPFKNIGELFLPGVLEGYRMPDGNYGAIPLYTDNCVAFYNVKMFEQAGLTRAPDSWQETVEFGKKLTKFDARGNMTQAGFAHWEWFTHVFFSYLWDNGGGWVDNKGNLTVDSPQNRETVQYWLRDIYDTHKIASREFEEGFKGFMGGKVAVFHAGPWFYSSFSEVPELKWKAAPMPKHKERYTTMGGHSIGVTKKWKDDDLRVWEFVDYLTSKEVEAQLIIIRGTLPARKGVMLPPDVAKDPNWQVSIDSLQFTRAKPARYIENFQKAYFLSHEALSEILTNPKVSIEQTLKRLHEEIKAL